jgi:hypothetical protein
VAAAGLIVAVADAAVEVIVDAAEVAGTLVITGVAPCWLLAQAPSAAAAATVMAFRKMRR